MKKKKREIEEDDDEFSDDEEEAVIVGEIPTVSVPRHIKKRSLKNKALSVSFSEKDLKDFVGGFHKRKKKRRKEAEKQKQEKDRLKRIEARKRRKQEKELALYGGALKDPSAPDLEHDEGPGNDNGEDELPETAPVSETKTYESDYTTITVNISELNGEENDELRPVRPVTVQGTLPEKNNKLSVKKKPMKIIQRRKPQKRAKKAAGSKKDKRKGKSKR